MREGLALLLAHAFDELGLHRVRGQHPAGERRPRSPSCAAPGFRREGFSPRYLKIRGRWRDHERWAITAEDAPRARDGPGRRPDLGPRAATELSPSGRCAPPVPGDYCAAQGDTDASRMERDDDRHRDLARSRPWLRSRSRVTARPAALVGGARASSCSSRGSSTTAAGASSARYWLSIDGDRGGFVVSPRRDLVRERARPELQAAPGRALGPRADLQLLAAPGRAWRARFMIDPQQHADTLFQVARRVGAL